MESQSGWRSAVTRARISARRRLWSGDRSTIPAIRSASRRTFSTCATTLGSMEGCRSLTWRPEGKGCSHLGKTGHRVHVCASAFHALENSGCRLVRHPAQPTEPRHADAIDGTIGRRLRLLREARYMPLTAMALSLGKSVGYLSRVEHGLSSLPVWDLVRIAELLGMDLLSLVSPVEAGEGSSPIRRAADTSPITFHPSGITKRSLAPVAPGDLPLFLMTL